MHNSRVLELCSESVLLRHITQQGSLDGIFQCILLWVGAGIADAILCAVSFVIQLLSRYALMNTVVLLPRSSFLIGVGHAYIFCGSA